MLAASGAGDALWSVRCRNKFELTKQNETALICTRGREWSGVGWVQVAFKPDLEPARPCPSLAHRSRQLQRALSPVRTGGEERGTRRLALGARRESSRPDLGPLPAVRDGSPWNRLLKQPALVATRESDETAAYD